MTLEFGKFRKRIRNDKRGVPLVHYEYKEKKFKLDVIIFNFKKKSKRYVVRIYKLDEFIDGTGDIIITDFVQVIQILNSYYDKYINIQQPKKNKPEPIS